MTIFLDPSLIALNTDGTRISGAKLYTYVAGSTTPTAVYSDSALTTPRTNPVDADSDGLFPVIYLDDTVSYKFVLTDGSDPGDDPDMETVLWTRDDYSTGLALSYDFTIGASGAVGTSQVYLGPYAVRDFTIADDFAGSRARLETAPSASTVFSFQVNDVEVGTITFAMSSQTGTFSSSGAITINDGDYIDIVAPATTNSAAGLRVTIKGQVSV